MSSAPFSVVSDRNFGIKWDLLISTLPDAQGNQIVIEAFQKDFSKEGLQIEFEIQTSNKQSYWTADISIYGLNGPTTNTILQQGMEVKLSAGFQKPGAYGTIFQGLILQPLWERINGIDFKLTLHCIIGLVEETNNFASFNVAGGLTQRQFIAQMAKNCTTPLTIQDISGADDVQQSSRGEVVFGQPGLYLENIASQNLSNFWISNAGVNVRKLIGGDGSNIPTIIYSPNDIIGTPQQTQDGVILRVPLDPRIQVGQQFQLNYDVAVKQLPRQRDTFPTILDQDGKYAIAAVNFIGSSRGNVWMTEMVGYTSVGSKLSLFEAP
jgi:hypothetical protein